MTYLQIAALCYVFVYYGLLLGLRSYLLYVQTGINPLRHMGKRGKTGLVEIVFVICFTMVSVIAFNYAFLEENYARFLFPLESLEMSWIANMGIILGFSGLALGFWAQLQMGNSWRLGINHQDRTNLVTKGIYQYSRNPIYLGILISNIGFFMMMPNVVSLLWLAVSYIALEIKIRLEEKYLQIKHETNYRAYQQKVRRWI